MLRLGLLLLITFAVLTQVSQAVADVHKTHQSNIEQHLKFDHDESQVDSKDLPHRGQTSFDCHHCCHCHASFHLYAMKTDKSLDLPKLKLTRSGYTQSYNNPLSSPLFRPPISS